MRLKAIALLTGLTLVGCGSDSKNAETKSAGIPLSISNPSTTATAANQKIPTIEQYAQAVKQLIQQANAAVVSGRNNVAVQSLSQAIGITPEDATLFRMRADVYALQGENANARADFSTAVRLAPGNAELYNFRGYFLMSQGLPNEAKADFDKAVELNPMLAAALNNRGLLALTSKNYKEAEADFSKAIDADRKLSDAWNNRGFARMKQAQFASAMSDIKQALRLKDDYVTAWNNCGLVAMAMENYDEAEKSFARATELDPMDARWINHHRVALLKQNRFAEAQKDLQKIEWINQLTSLSQQANRNPKDPRTWISRGQHLMNGEQFGAAIQDFTRALVVNPGNPQALFVRANAWVRAGDFQKAMLDCEQSLVSRPSREAYSLRGDLWMRLENLDLAIADFESAGRFDSQVVEAYEKRSAKHREAGEIPDAEADIARANEIREAMVDKLDDSPAATSSAEGFDPEKSVQ